MRKLTVKQIDELDLEDFRALLTDKNYKQMKKLNITYVWQLLDLYKDGARLAGLAENEKYLNITDYLQVFIDEMEV